jgi:uncharacterized membrane protein
MQALMATFIVLYFIVGTLFPEIPAVVYVIGAIAGGAGIYIVYRRVSARSMEIVADERDERNSARSMALTFRVPTPAYYPAGVLSYALSDIGTTVHTVGLVLVAIGMLQMVFHGIVSVVLDTRTR